MHLSDQKSQLRTSIDERLKHLKENERSAESRSLCRRLTEGIPEGTPICAFFPMRSEPDITPFLEEVLHRKDPLYLPCFDGTLIFRKASNLSTLVRGKLGTLEPPSTAAPIANHQSQIANRLTILIPGRAFDAKGNRLGRGNGGYDKWIVEQREKGIPLRLIGVALEFQIVDSVPVESHDQKMDAVATARGINEC
ncbi:5-formyltetrahydrofolate cyclo-ligase [candidate division WOR-1 bacterium RIFCSPHIGHO2_01_FULL_53_15]|uniref:5-formyltetrahydrofolate cyclo-ligase n=1 Tax=candidate division WOR-1 bacterium RIFCSPHIGHO2_01_FULL_53_15 TaxID=1802564 RepID=A0A1F4Q2Z9_UNCSA|nr:MAG: 5-formyltetrahydrofolate cyclo-ligase [candidate division WOR-1 bacterium RIFCSPHIGHO2_01_FULL_53_15]OGJ63738.1 MAG: 5-formyltetrahydrofolate cyclo-ligase [Candidatus Peribacteria bacterium RIFCSPHIGHO2_02_FULL_53_20]OGJ65254.1 MAG: 5-formyltetrahydrofolate cyclo-ligase [Candidatus Peribacteria bacterium RIFCSPHIGHO2_12_FULL_55_11]OGJ71436.1 MAG: 5-formyltetrahydrofolate cyclo-ligase [Candidatus Peribacteria bacterium RIFCSPLOWO2_12_FULL_53_10]